MSSRSEKLKKFYEGKIRETQEMRKNSPLIAVRKFNNEIKRVLISQAAASFKKDIIVLDLCGGQGGDMPKFHHNKNVKRVHLVDISVGSVQEAKSRYESNDQWKRSFKASFYTGDAFSLKEMEKLLPLTKESVDLINCQFAFHYAFENEERASDAFSVISHFLVKGGKCVMTIPNSEWIMQQNSETISNGAYIIRFSSNTKDEKNDCNKRDRGEDADYKLDDFGHSYVFTMGDSVVDVPEYLVKRNVFNRLCEKFGLRVSKWTPFRDYCVSQSISQEKDETAWDTAQLYVVVELEK